MGMTSYRASGGGDLLKSIGIDTDNMEDRIVNRYPAIRSLIYECIMEHKVMDPQSCLGIIGTWKFVPESANKKIASDMQMLFGNQ